MVTVGPILPLTCPLCCSCVKHEGPSGRHAFSMGLKLRAPHPFSAVISQRSYQENAITTSTVYYGPQPAEVTAKRLRQSCTRQVEPAPRQGNHPYRNVPPSTVPCPLQDGSPQLSQLHTGSQMPPFTFGVSKGQCPLKMLAFQQMHACVFGRV